MTRIVAKDIAGREIETGDYVKAVEPPKSKDEKGRKVVGRVRSITQAAPDAPVTALIVHPHLPGGVLDAFRAPANECEIVLRSDGTEPKDSEE